MIEAGFRGYKSGQVRLQIGAALGISNKDKKKNANRGKEFSNRGNRDFKLGQGLQVGAEQIQPHFQGILSFRYEIGNFCCLISYQKRMLGI